MTNIEQTELTKQRAPLAGWLGGKCQLSRRIVQSLPEHTCYVEPFAGAAWVLFRKPESKVEVINDINREIVIFYRVIQNHLEEFIRYFKWVLVSRDEFERLKRVNPDTMTDIQRAARLYYLQQMCFGGRLQGASLGYSSVRAPRLNLLRIEEHLSAAHLRLARAYIECLPYADVIKRYDNVGTVFYIDPPYWDCEHFYGKGIFEKADFTTLANQLCSIKGNFVLSLNDTPDIRKIFGMFSFESAQVNYTCSNGKNTKAKELLIRNY